MKSKTELTVLAADKPHKPLGFRIVERNGVSLYQIVNGEPDKDPVSATEDLIVGAQYTSVGIFGNNILWTAAKNSDGSFKLESGPGCIAFLERGTDERNCWIVTGQSNKLKI